MEAIFLWKLTYIHEIIQATPQGKGGIYSKCRSGDGCSQLVSRQTETHNNQAEQAECRGYLCRLHNVPQRDMLSTLSTCSLIGRLISFSIARTTFFYYSLPYGYEGDILNGKDQTYKHFA